MKIYVEVIHEIEVDDKYLPLLTNFSSNYDGLHRELCAEVEQTICAPYADDASEDDTVTIKTVYDNCWEPIIET
jgi:hypothetical protein